jgi:Protein of unknown function (DUF1493)
MSPGTGLQTDLRLDGDDLIDTLEILTRKFDVDLSDFNLAKYGHEEGFYLTAKDILYAMRGLDPMEGRRVITLAMIEESLRLGRWAGHQTKSDIGRAEFLRDNSYRSSKRTSPGMG